MRLESLVLVFGLLMVTSLPSSADCIHGCSTISVGILDYVRITQPVESDCSPDCSAGTGTQYRIEILDGTCGGDVMDEGDFCTSEPITAGKIYQVIAISSGCSGTPQGCVKICGPCD